MGMEFASELEMGHGMILEYMKKAGLFDKVEFQVPFVLLEKTKYFDPISETEKVEQPIKYILDFVVHK